MELTQNPILPENNNKPPKTSSFIISGKVPYIAVLLLCVSSFYLGQKTVNPSLKVATLEKGAILIDAVFMAQDKNQSLDINQLKKQISEPIVNSMKKYQSMGYVVIDTSLDDKGRMTIESLPKDTIDITEEVRHTLNLPPIKATPSH